MNVEVILTNARIVTADSEFDGTVVVRDGLIAEVADCRSHVADALDLEGDYLVPGLVELHTDNMEKHFAPRPGVRWPSLSAVMAHDTQIAAAGITTVFDSLALGDVRGDTDRVLNRERMIDAVLAASERRLFRADHRLHLRCEIVADDAVDAVDRWIDLPLVGLLSINDHTPGQRQFLDPEKLRLYHTKKYGMTNDEFELFSARATALHHKNAARHRPFARRPGRHPLFRLCAGEPDGKRLQAAQCRRRHRVARGGARGLAYAGARRGPRRSRRDRATAPRRSRARPRIRGRPRGAGSVARR